MTDLLTLPEAAALVRAPESTLRYWRQRGDGPPSFRVGRRVLYRRDAVEAWLRVKEAAGTRGSAA